MCIHDYHSLLLCMNYTSHAEVADFTFTECHLGFTEITELYPALALPEDRNICLVWSRTEPIQHFVI
jgi:hypothetical protein